MKAMTLYASLDDLSLRCPDRRFMLIERFHALRKALRTFGLQPENLDRAMVHGTSPNLIEKLLAMALVYCGLDYEKAVATLEEPCGLRVEEVANIARLIGKGAGDPRDTVSCLVKQLMETMRSPMELTGERTLIELYNLATSDISDVLTWEAGTHPSLKAPSDIHPSALKNVQEVQVDTKRDGTQTVKVKLYDKLKALELLARHQGLLVERVDVTVHEGLAESLEKARRRVLDGECQREPGQDMIPSPQVPSLIPSPQP